MITFNKKITSGISVLLATVLLSTQSLSAAVSPAVKDSIKGYFQQFPWIGLIANKIHYGPITVSDVNIYRGDKLAIVKPGEELHGSLRYKIDSKDSKFKLHHLVIGIKDIGGQACVAHSFDLWDSDGKGNFTLKAPTKPGIYEVRFYYSEALTCKVAQDSWFVSNNEPSAEATIGVIIVE